MPRSYSNRVTTPTALVAAARDVAGTVRGQSAATAELRRALLVSRIYCERGQSPGFQAFRRSDGAGLVPVFSSVTQLALARGTVPWFALSGAELLAILPDEYDMLLDPASPTPLWIKATGHEIGAAESRTSSMRYGAAQHVGFADGTHRTSWASWTIASLNRELGQVTVQQLRLSLGVRGVAVTRQRCAQTAFGLAGIRLSAVRPNWSAPAGITARIPGSRAWRTNLADPARRLRFDRSDGPVVVECGSAVRHTGPRSR